MNILNYNSFCNNIKPQRASIEDFLGKSDFGQFLEFENFEIFWA